jgi:hypothetical protein
MSETEIMRAIRFGVTEAGLGTLWRNNVGFDAQNKIRYGLGLGSADLVGIATGGRFLAIEVKTSEGRLRVEQRAWLRVVEARGGIALVCRSAEEAIRALSA